MFGVIFGAATVYLALKAGLTESARPGCRARVAGLVIAFIAGSSWREALLAATDHEHFLQNLLRSYGYDMLGVAFFLAMGYLLYRIGTRKPARNGL